MNKRDLLIVLGLAALWLMWPFIDRTIIKPMFPDEPPRQERARPAEEGDKPAVEPEEPRSRTTEIRAPAPGEPAETVAPSELDPEPVVAEETPPHYEQIVRLENSLVQVELSSLGATVKMATLYEYRQKVDPNSDHMVLDFNDSPALAYEGLDGLTRNNGFSVEVVEEGRSVIFHRTAANGLTFQRVMTLGDGYQVEVKDSFQNSGLEALSVPSHGVQTGTMRNLPDVRQAAGLRYLGVDILLTGGKGVEHRSKKFSKWLKGSTDGRVSQKLGEPVDWVAVKNKFFTQIITPSDRDDLGADDYKINLVEDPEQRGQPLEVSASIYFPKFLLRSGETYSRTLAYYVGPKKLSDLRALGLHQDDIMEFGMWSPIAKLLLRALVGMNKVIHSYGVSIMILTFFIKIIFWPITHRGTESMRRMQELQPLMAEIRAKHKDNQQKQQQAMMALYKEHKINPLGGCLPMVIQIPVFISLFYVLRSAIELRFASFLWIRDLSEPEQIIPFGFTIPLLGWDSLNILPLLMSATMFWQQKLTPTAASADPKQQQTQQTMMKIMPFMMLFFLYNFASGLALYWTTQNGLMILQQYLYQKRKKAKEEAEANA